MAGYLEIVVNGEPVTVVIRKGERGDWAVCHLGSWGNGIGNVSRPRSSKTWTATNRAGETFEAPTRVAAITAMVNANENGPTL